MIGSMPNWSWLIAYLQIVSSMEISDKDICKFYICKEAHIYLDEVLNKRRLSQSGCLNFESQTSINFRLVSIYFNARVQVSSLLNWIFIDISPTLSFSIL